MKLGQLSLYSHHFSRQLGSPGTVTMLRFVLFNGIVEAKHETQDGT